MYEVDLKSIIAMLNAFGYFPFSHEMDINFMLFLFFYLSLSARDKGFGLKLEKNKK